MTLAVISLMALFYLLFIIYIYYLLFILLMTLFYAVPVSYTWKHIPANSLGGWYFVNNLKDNVHNCVSLMRCAGLNAWTELNMA
jgi:hypothetical protein